MPGVCLYRLPHSALLLAPSLSWGRSARNQATPRLRDSAVAAGSRTTLGLLKQIDAGELSVGYADLGPASGTPMLLLHGWPYDIHSFVDVAPALAAAHDVRSPPSILPPIPDSDGEFLQAFVEGPAGALLSAVADRVGSAWSNLENEALYDGRAQRARDNFAPARTFAPLTGLPRILGGPYGSSSSTTAATQSPRPRRDCLSPDTHAQFRRG